MKRIILALPLVLTAWCDRDAEKRDDKVAEAVSSCQHTLWETYRNPNVTVPAREAAWKRCLALQLGMMHATNEEVKGVFEDLAHSGQPIPGVFEAFAPIPDGDLK